MLFKRFAGALCLLFCAAALFGATAAETAAMQVLERAIGDQAQKFSLIEEAMPDAVNDRYTVDCDGEQITVRGNSAVALARGAYDYLRNASDSIVSWSGSQIRLDDSINPYQTEVESPYRFRYYLNVVTHGYSAAFWDWERWEKELDWMALHGMNMPLIAGAYEAILYRVWKNLGLTDEEALEFFTGPAHFPWNRMGNITQWDGPLPLDYFDKQVELTHLQLKRMRELGMEPIVTAFAGFVPRSLKRIHPELELLGLSWGGFDDDYQAGILTSDNPLFVEIGKMYVQEWEKEFGKANYYLADSFNEMDVPVHGSMEEQYEQLAGFGEAVYMAIKEANPDAVWVMQGWTFPYFVKNGALFWTPGRLEALMSKVPDDKLLILDLANEYNELFWKIDPSWKTYKGFFGKQWVYSFIPNMGGKVDFTGVLDFYATAPIEALNYEHKGNLVGYGTAPEGIENNEVVYELITDMGWKTEPIDVSSWLVDYYRCRYGKVPEAMKQGIDLMHKSVYSTFTDHPRRGFQFRKGQSFKATAHRSPEFLKAIELILSCSEELADQPLYVADALELAAFYLSVEAEDQAKQVERKIGKGREKALAKLSATIGKIDLLLESHPLLRLQPWVDWARAWGDSEEQKDYYEANAKRLITTWGGEINEYSARLWSGLIRDYYGARWQFEAGGKRISIAERDAWEENWIMTPGISTVEPLEEPLKTAVEWVEKSSPKKDRR